MLHLLILWTSLADPSPRWLGAMVTKPLVTTACGPYHSEGNVQQECAWVWLWWESRGHRRSWESRSGWVHHQKHSSNAQLDPQWPRLLQQPSFCKAPDSSQRKARPGVRSPGHWGWLAAPWQWASEMSLLLPAEPSSRQCQIRGDTYWFPKVFSPWWGLGPGPPKPSKTQLGFSWVVQH